MTDLDRSTLEPPKPCDKKRGRYWCTLDLDHEGPHIAGGPGGVVFARWSDRKPK